MNRERALRLSWDFQDDAHALLAVVLGMIGMMRMRVLVHAVVLGTVAIGIGIAAAPPTLEFTPLSLAHVGNSVAGQSHYWFPHTGAMFLGSSSSSSSPTLVVALSLQDDSAACVPARSPLEHCLHCYIPTPCLKHNLSTVVVSRDGGKAWQSFALHAGAFPQDPSGGLMLNSEEYMSTAHLTKPTLGSTVPSTVSQVSQVSFAGKGAKLFHNADGTFATATSSHNVTFGGFPATGTEWAANISAVLRWCEPVQLRGSSTTVELVQLEFPTVGAAANKGKATGAGTRLGRSLALFTSTDNFTFTFSSLVASHNTPTFSPYSNGPCEPALAELHVSGVEGTHSVLLAVFRVDSYASYYTAMSLDGGRTWSHPEPINVSSTSTPEPLGIVGSVRPRLRVVDRSDGSQAVLLVGGRPGLALWVGVPTHSRTTNTVTFAWREVNLGETHNNLVQMTGMPEAFKYSQAFVNRSQPANYLHAESTAYTHLYLLPQGSSSRNDSAQPRHQGKQPARVHRGGAGTSTGVRAVLVLVYDRLAHGWMGPNMTSQDHVFAMQFSISIT